MVDSQLTPAAKSQKPVPTSKAGLGTFIFGLVFGGAVGIISALLNAPRSGKETRHQLQEKGEELIAGVEQTTQGVRKRIEGESISETIQAGKAEARRLNRNEP